MTDAQRQALEEVEKILATLGVYTVERFLGTGGAADVYLARHRIFRELRAIKFLHPVMARYRVVIKRLEDEAHIMHALDHPNLVKVYEVGFPRVGDFVRPYLVMDFLEGGTLEDHLNQFGAMPPKQAVRAAVATLRGLQAAHDRGIVHRDIKPQNILFDAQGIPKVTDFGIARVQEGMFLGTRQGGKTRQGVTMGTLGYMPPEQNEGELELIDHRADIHALGVTLYVMLTCRKPGENSAFHKQLTDYPESLESVPKVLRAVLHTATAKNRESRFSTAAAMADELEILATGFPDDPANTPALGSAPAVKAQVDSVADATDPQILRIGGTLAPSPTQAMPGDKEVAPASSDGIVFEELHGSVSTRTIHPEVDEDAEAAEFAVIRQMARRSFYRRVVFPAVGLLFALVVGVSVWFVTRPVPITHIEQVAEPVVKAPPVEAESLSALAATSITQPPPEPIKTPVVKPNHTPKLVVRPSPEATVTVQEKALVRLILKPDTTATVTLTGDSGMFTITGGSREVPQGTYRVSVEMPGREAPQTGTLTVSPGLTAIECDSRFKRCKWSK